MITKVTLVITKQEGACIVGLMMTTVIMIITMRMMINDYADSHDDHHEQTEFGRDYELRMIITMMIAIMMAIVMMTTDHHSKTGRWLHS